MIELRVMRSYERQDHFGAHGRRLPTTTRKNLGAKELRDALKAQAHKLEFRPAPLVHTSALISVTWPIDNGRNQVARTFYPPFTPVNREEDFRVAYEAFSQRLDVQVQEGGFE